jgi:hypothetical protein
MKEFDISNKKIGLNILLWVLVIFVLLSLNQWSRNYQLKREISKIRKEMKKDLEEQIKARELVIQKLRKDNDFKRGEIEKMNQKIDSLEKVKNKIKIKYVDIVKDINDMDAEQIKNYWDEEFN